MRHLDPAVRKSVFGTLFIAVAIFLGVVAGYFASQEPVDLRWAEYTEPVFVGAQAVGSPDTIARIVDGEGVPVANSDRSVDLTFKRCGPVAEVEAESHRTWVLTTSDTVFQGFEGLRVDVVLGAAPNCVRFDINYPIPVPVWEAARNADGGVIELRFNLTPVDPALGIISIESEKFRLWEPGLELETQLIVVE